ncbi:hypothetical protein MVEN_02026600 [Mycena venus]|uniref:EH domain-containing protein n=1 Tax=Mycena venus TaxID=2733690 RepID=A0A8H6XBJ7_9AGAR|nr:hypothetical protein MVEN_02026600 [Mycena venus]
MPASSLQSRISAFESLSNPRTAVLQTPLSPRVIPSTPPRVSPSPSPPNLGRKSSLIDFKIDLKDWVLDDGSPPRSNGFKKTPTQASFNGDDALIHFSPPKPSSVKAPPLPPRKPSLASLKSTASSASLPLKKPTPVLPPPARRGDSLTVEHTYPPLEPRGHTHGSSISSFHSVFLSDRSPSPSPTAAQHTIEHMTGSSAESFEELSASAAFASPTTSALISHDWEKAMARRKPPKLPARPPAATVSPPPYTARRTAPTLGPRVHTELRRPALLAPRRRTAAGWRGLSVDLIRDPESAGANGHQQPTSPLDDDAETLPGPVIRVLWSRSRLPLPVLSAIWTECDPGRTGALDREAFARGMWRIDEELRRAESSRTNGARRRGLR